MSVCTSDFLSSRPRQHTTQGTSLSSRRCHSCRRDLRTVVSTSTPLQGRSVVTALRMARTTPHTHSCPRRCAWAGTARCVTLCHQRSPTTRRTAWQGARRITSPPLFSNGAPQSHTLRCHSCVTLSQEVHQRAQQPWLSHSTQHRRVHACAAMRAPRLLTVDAPMSTHHPHRRGMCAAGTQHAHLPTPHWIQT